jgi:hypothetical protein
MTIAAVTQAERDALRSLAKPIMDEGGPNQVVDIMIALEGIVAGVFLLCVKLGGDEPVAETFMEGVKQRLAAARLGPFKTEGEA